MITPSTSCAEKIAGRDEALQLLAVAGGECLDKALKAVQKHTPDDLAAAYLIRAERNRDPVDLLRALHAARHKSFNRALALEKLYLTKEAIRARDDVYLSDRGSQWADEARAHRDRLKVEPSRWRPDDLQEALGRRDRGALAKIVREFPSDAARYFETSDILDLEASRLLADILYASGEPYPRAIVNAIDRTTDRAALEKGIRDFRRAVETELRGKWTEAADLHEQAATLLERANNDLYLAARFRAEACKFRVAKESLPVLDEIAPIATKHGYRDLSGRIHTLRGPVLEFASNYFGALAAYDEAIRSVGNAPTAVVEALQRRSENYAATGRADLALDDALKALQQLHAVTDLKARHQAYASAATAARALGYPAIALQFQNAAVETIRKVVIDDTRKKNNLTVALRARAEIHVELGNDSAAEADLQEASQLAEDLGKTDLLPLLRMRITEVRGQALLKKRPADAERMFSEAIALAGPQDSTSRAVLHFKRAAARRLAGHPNANEDIDEALSILRKEATLLRDHTRRGDYENLWSAYFARFQTMHHDMVVSRIDQGDIEGAFLYGEQARGFEPMQLLLQSHPAPPGFRKIETHTDLRQQLAALPDDTVILQYLVLDNATYTWVLTRGNIDLVRQRAGRKDIERWVAGVIAAVESEQNDPFTAAMRAAYTELFRTPLAKQTAATRERIVIVPDGPMYGLPFAGLQGNKEEGFLIERASISTAASTSMYLYALARDRQFALNPRPSVLAVGNPAIDPRTRLRPLIHAAEEARELARDYYPQAEVLIGADATVERFLASARNAGIIHFAGHGITNPHSPWTSMLVLAAEKKESGELTAEKLMQRLSELESTRLVVLGACSTAAGEPVGPQGLSPLVRPLIAANVPAVVGTLWDVKDATAKDLLVSLHCHYRHGDDVAVALRKAQLERLRNKKSARTWAPFQVTGYAASPYARPAALEETDNDHVCTANSLHRPDGLHSQ